ncbi:MAG: carboxypeptidase-like regulatory domain-containing protein, partial [Agriterribacter sp.]
MLKQKFVRFSILLLSAILFSGVFTAQVFAQAKQTGIIEGRILNADNQPEENVIVILTPSDKQTISDDNGYFQFRNIPYGQYTVSVSSLGVNANPVSIELNAEKVSVGNIQLKENATVLERVIVSSS